ncbi:hypothetical protein LIER_42181 [Lithospermum erythrorhizon]|uniref:Uncharacterized protein n=1 Tax=Lithospermum erythrorhizon TaxID=34254 RepID=A0AAV3RP79_LITER
MEAFHAIQALLSTEEGRKHPSSDPMDAFSLSTLYMIKALNAQYTATRREVKEISSEKKHEALESTQISLKERDEVLNSAKDALSAEQEKYQKLREEKQAMELELAKRYNTLEANLEKPRNDQASLAKDVEGSHSANVEPTKRSEVAEARALKLLDLFTRLKEDWHEEYFEDLLVANSTEAPAEVAEVATPAMEGDAAEIVGGGTIEGVGQEIADEEIV